MAALSVTKLHFMAKLGANFNTVECIGCSQDNLISML